MYVDPAARDMLSESDAEALADKIEDAGEPVFVAVLPAGFPDRKPLP
ncbi:TPM domain-containing protein OS=Streptomyces tendae OX=1932 GN=GUR47_36675 PE=4 SV=1 [Streptomyces tendae]